MTLTDDECKVRFPITVTIMTPMCGDGKGVNPIYFGLISIGNIFQNRLMVISCPQYFGNFLSGVAYQHSGTSTSLNVRIWWVPMTSIFSFH